MDGGSVPGERRESLVMLTLDAAEDFPFFSVPQDSLYFVPFDSVLRVVFPPECVGMEMDTNVPLFGSFVRKAFRKVPIVATPAGDYYAELRISLPGVFACRFRVNGEPVESAEFSFLVNPETKISSKKRTEVVPLDGLCVQTQITRCLGPLSEWDAHMKLAAHCGYNCIHFSPVQPLGISQSAYCILDHLDIRHEIFEGREQQLVTAEERIALLQSSLMGFEANYGLLSMVDVLWNHVAVNSAFLAAHPEIGFNTVNTPILRAPSVVDRAMIAFSTAYGAATSHRQDYSPLDDCEFGDPGFSVRQLTKQIFQMLSDYIEENPTAPHFLNPPSNDDELDHLLSLFRSALDFARVHEFYQCDVAETLEQYAAQVATSSEVDMVGKKTAAGGADWLFVHPMCAEPRYQGLVMKAENRDEDDDAGVDSREIVGRLCGFLRFTGRRFGASVGSELLAALHLPRNELSMALIAMNHSIKLQVEAWLEEYVRNCGGTVRYERVGMDAPKKQMLIGRQHTLVSPYFSMIQGTGKDAEAFSCVHNGWVFHSGRGGLNGVNFPTWSGGLALLTRRVIPWGDNAKLRYGGSPEDCPVLWDVMEQYTRTMARLFHGLRIDNAHATPIHVAQYLLDAARDTNPHLFVAAELFTGSLAKDRAFVRAVGVNLLIREAIHAADTATLARFLHEAGGRRPVGSLSDLSLHCIAHPSTCQNPPRPFMHRYSRDAEDLIAPPLEDASSAELPRSSTHTPDGSNEEVEISDLKPSAVPALFYDVTHDNPSQTQLRTTEQTLSSACLLAMCVCAVGSTRGNDELFEEPVRVTESKTYPVYGDLTQDLPGIIPARAVVGKMHKQLSQAGFSEFHVDVSDAILTVQRHNPLTHEAIFCVNLPAFRAAQPMQKFTLSIPGRIVEVLLSARLTVLESYETEEASRRADEKRRLSFAHAFGMDLEAHTSPKGASQGVQDSVLRSKGKLLIQIESEADQNDEEGFVGLSGKLEFSSSEYIQDAHVEVTNASDSGEKFTTLEVELIPGDVLIVHTALWEDAEAAHLTVEAALANRALRYSIEQLTLSDLNVLLWKCAQEEMDDVQTPTFDVPDFGRLFYAGIGSLVPTMLQDVIPGDNLGHPLCTSLRGGNWLLDFMTERLRAYIALGFKNLVPISEWLEKMFVCLGELPRYLIPRHFTRVVMHMFKTLVDILVDFYDASQRSVVAPDFSATLPKPSPHLPFPFVAKRRREEFFVETGKDATHPEPSLDQDALHMFLMVCASQFYGYLPNSRLLSGRSMDRVKSEIISQVEAVENEISMLGLAGDEKVSELKALEKKKEQLLEARRCAGDHADITCPFSNSIAAGLPHFAEGIMRNWGRDTFIALPGLLLVTQNFSEAANILLGFASCVNRGLLPNLLAGGDGPRFNCRDSCWWWLRAVRLYCETAPEGRGFLHRLGPRLFPCSIAGGNIGLWTISDAIQEILQCHVKGIHFREDGAGLALDARMQDEGFNVDVTFDSNTGLVFGGNLSNCGTWMDKMGESTTAGNFGVPATPRDGCAVEIAGLLGCTLRWLSTLCLDDSKDFPYRGVVLENGDFLSYEDWFHLLARNFEKWFYVPLSEDDDRHHFVDREVVRLRGIYKDTHGSKVHGADYRMRPNVCVAMAVAPELFDAAHARAALGMIKERLAGPLGMRTLDLDDPGFFPRYDMADSSEFGTAKGFSYHNGPEWLWLSGFFFMALLNFPLEGDTEAPETRKWIVKRLFKLRVKLLRESPAFSLPELTNFDGENCPYCCDAQAWSVGTILETLNKLRARERTVGKRPSSR